MSGQGIKEWLASTVNDTHTPQGRRFSWLIQGLILLSLLAFSLDTLPNLSPTYRTYLRIFEIISVAIFTVEYLARFIVASPKSSFVFSFLGLVDLMAILPFYLSLGIDLRSLRVFRLMRLFRLLKLARYSAAVQRFHRALLIAKEELVLFLFVAGSLIFVTAVGIYYFENQAQPEAFASVFHALWWSIVTLTTVGYGDVYPVTTGGKVFTFLMLLVGLGVVSVPAGIVATALSQARDVEQQEQTESAQ